MDQRLRSITSDLRKKSSSDAADWLLERYPVDAADWYEALAIIPHLSWKNADKVRLAECYLSRIPFAHPQPYEAFASFMKVPRLIDVIRKYVPSDDSKKDLLEYHVAHVLKRAAKTAEDHSAVLKFLVELKAS